MYCEYVILKTEDQLPKAKQKDLMFQLDKNG